MSTDLFDDINLTEDDFDVLADLLRAKHGDDSDDYAAWPLTDGNCNGSNPELFFPERGASVDEPKSECSTCPVRIPCLVEGLPEKSGIWGGLSERERRRLRKHIAGMGITLPNPPDTLMDMLTSMLPD